MIVLFAYFQMQAQIVINEYSAANLHRIYDNFKSTEDWIELYNAGPDTVNIGNYFLSDDKASPTKWRLPANLPLGGGSFVVIWASGRDTFSDNGIHTNFRLTQTKKNAESIVLSDAGGQVIDEIKMNKTKHYQSRGRTMDGGNTWAIFTKPTINSTNNVSQTFKSFADRPSFDVKPGFYNSFVKVTIINNAPNSVVRYTLDGLEPKANATEYVGPITITSTTVLKAVAFSNDTNVLPSFVEFGTYFIDEKHSLVVVSIAGDSLDKLANGNKSYRPFGSIEYFNKNGERKANSYGEYNSHGQDSWVNDQRSIDFVARDECGYNKGLDEKIFALSDRTEFQRLILRAAGDDNYPATDQPEHNGDAHVRDAYVHNLVKKGGLHLDVRLSEKAIIYLNGQYWGVYDLREIPDDSDYTEYYYGQGKYDLQYILTWGNTWVEYGDSLTARREWKTLYDYIQKNDMANQLKFDTVTAQYDVKSLVDYVIVNSVTVCSDWLNYNTGWWRGKNPSGSHQKWGYILWDNDATFGYYINYTGVKDTSAKALPCNVEKITSTFSDPMGHIKTLNKLLKNPGFKQYYVSRYIDLMNNTFSCENMLGYLDTIVQTIDPEMHRHIDRWGGTYEEWRQNVQRLRFFIERRCDSLQSGLKTCYSLNGPYPVTFDINPNGAGKLQINSSEVTQFPYTGKYFGGIDINLVATANNALDYKFDKYLYSNGKSTVNDSFLIQRLRVTGQDTVIGSFVKVSTSLSDLPSSANTFVASAYPTVFSGAFSIVYDLPETSVVTIKLYNQVGQEVIDVLNGSQKISTGHYITNVQIPDSGLAAGIYFLKIQAGDKNISIKLINN